MNIVCATDNNFVQHCAVTLISILKNNTNDINIYLLTEELSEDNESKLKQLVTKNGGQLHIILVDGEILKECPMPNLSMLDHISVATYYRLLISKLIPKHIDKVIYLDCDIIVRHNLNDLWNCSISEFALGAVYQVTNSNVDSAKRLGYPAKFGYFNAGVLLLNLKYWRENYISEKLFEYLNFKKEVIVYHDQDALNGLLYNKCLRLPCKWNMLTIFFMKDTLTINDIDNGKILNDHMDYKGQLLIEKDDPTVIHFVYKPKPWNVGCTHPYRSEYFKYLRLTPWFRYKVQSRLTLLFIEPKVFYRFIKEMLIRIYRGNPYLRIDTKN